MALKYRIVYDRSSRYSKHTALQRWCPYFLPAILCVAFVLALLFSPNPSKVYSALLPGNPEITNEAFQLFSESIRNGVSFSGAVNVFCETIMGSQ